MAHRIKGSTTVNAWPMAFSDGRQRTATSATACRVARPRLLLDDRHDPQQPEEPTREKRSPTIPGPSTRHQDKPPRPRLLGCLGQVDDALAIDDPAIGRDPTISQDTDHRLASLDRSPAILR
jgi:hypothetical protein